MNQTAKVFIIDDDSAVRESLTLLLEQGHITVETFANAEDFLTAERWEPCSCAIVDIRMLGMNGMQLQSELTRRGCRMPLVFLTGYGDIAQSVQAIKAGAVDFLTKPVTAKELLRSVQEALQESQRRFAQVEIHQTYASRLGSLTEREREVMSLAVQGLANKDVARRLGISHRTVEIHRAKVFHKTGAASLIDLGRIANMMDDGT